MNLRFTSIFLISLFSTSVESSVYGADDVSFLRDVRPILSEHCFNCHGPDAAHRQAYLRLDLKAAFENRDLVVPGKPDESELFERITSDDDDLRMPPPDFLHQLKADEIEVIRMWIVGGAKWQNHWSFEAPNQKMPIPDAGELQAIDNFVRRKLKSTGLGFSKQATKRELIRRATLDLTGLPPTRSEIRDFLNDSSDKAFEKVVDRLLASPHYGEQMALHWLDQARYADTNGYSIDGGRHMWLYRDWVIHAYNQNKAFDEFITEQLAGDLLPNATTAQKIASGFNRNHMITHEGGTIDAENLVNYAVDRVKTTSEVFLGLTMGCAQCHDHKYDPISQQDYYRFFAFFNTLGDRGRDGDGGRNSSPTFMAKSVLPMESESQLQQELADHRERLKQPLASQTDWERRTLEELAQLGRNMKKEACEILGVSDPNTRGVFQVIDKGTIYVASPSGRSPSISVKLPIDDVTALRLEFIPDDRLPGKRSGHGRHKDRQGGFVLTAFHASANKLPSAQVNWNNTLKIKRAVASYSDPEFPPENTLDGRDNNGWSPFPKNDQLQSITFELAEPINSKDTAYVTIMLVWGGGGTGQHDQIGGKYRLSAISGNNDQPFVSREIHSILKLSATKRTTEQKNQLQSCYNSIAPEYAYDRHQINNLEERLAVINQSFQAMIMNTAKNPRKTFVLKRGQYDQPGKEVSAGLPSVLPDFTISAQDRALNRLDLARWMTHQDNPLTARVVVNRVWQMLFGNGLTSTSADFGSQGEFPSHPELLDWLSRDFVNNEWDIKRLVKKIVMSRTYRQSSRSSAKLMALDPTNRLLARGPRFRLRAESIRDLALASSGLLSRRFGGPSVRPYQPEGLWREISHYGSTPATSQYFVQDHGEKLYRRSLYTYWKRTSPPPALTIFDAPNREVCVVQRASTNTPLQALVMLNDPQFVEASRFLAERMIKSSDDSKERIVAGFEWVLSRKPSQRELQIVLRRFEKELQFYTKDTIAAQQLLNVGEAPRDESISPAEHAAWTIVANILFNMSEALTRG